jgi:hypothetical protein
MRRKFTITKLTVVQMNKSILYLSAYQFQTHTQRTIQSSLFLPDWTRPASLHLQPWQHISFFVPPPFRQDQHCKRTLNVETKKPIRLRLLLDITQPLLSKLFPIDLASLACPPFGAAGGTYWNFHFSQDLSALNFHFLPTPPITPLFTKGKQDRLSSKKISGEF